MKHNLITILILLSANLLFSQLDNIPLITVTGQSSVNVDPDYVIIGIQVNKQIRKDLNGRQLFGFDIFDEDDTDIRCYDFNGKEIHSSLIQTKGSIYIKEVFITLRNLDKLDEQLREFRKYGADNLIYFDYRISNYRSIKKQTRQDAIIKAKKKAQDLALQLDQSIGKAHSIKELDSKSYNWYTIDDKQNLEDITFETGADNYLIKPGYIVITSKIEVSFDLIK